MQPNSSSVLASLLLIAVFGALSASATPPVNDRCAGAINIPANSFPQLTPQVNITEATLINDPPLPSCATDISRSVWYSFRPGVTDVYRISTCGDAGACTTVRDTVMAMYTAAGGCGTLYTEVPNGCNDDMCNKQSEISTILVAGITYYIVVWQYGQDPPAPGQGLLQLLVQRGKPTNDDCSNPQEVQLNVPVFGRTLSAGNDYDFGNSVCFTGIGQTPVDTPGLDVVFSFTAPAADTYSFKVKDYNDNDLVIYVSPVCPMPDPGGTMNDCLAAANRNVGIAEEIICVPLTNGQQVFLFVDDRHELNRGSSFTLEVVRCVPELEPNNSFFSAQPFAFETTASMAPLDGVDYYALGAFTPGSRVFALIDAVSANVPDFDLRVVNSTDTLEYDTDNNDVPYGQSSGSVAGTPLTSDCTALRVSSSGVSEPYRLYAVVQPPPADATPEIEPNDILTQAQSSLKNYFAGTLPALGDEDLYTFDAVAGDVIFLGLDADPLRDRSPIDAQLELLNSCGSIMLSVDDLADNSITNTVPGALNATRPFSPAESIVHRASYSGRYYARVLLSPFGNALPGDYLLSITRNGFVGAGGTNTPPAIVNLSAPPVPENTNATLTATISDTEPSPKFAVTISWGDGSPNTVLALGVCENPFQATHQYPQPAIYPVTVTVRDAHGATTSAATTIQVTQSATAAKVNSIRRESNGNILLELEGTPNATYRIEISDNLQTWTQHATRTADATGKFQLIDTPPLPSRRFYRAVWP